MRPSKLKFTLLTVLAILSAMAPLLPQAHATCYANPLVGVNSATGVYFYISSGYYGTGPALVTAYHVVSGGSPTVYTNCGSQVESVLHYNQAKDWAILSTTGITFASYYLQGSASLNQGVNINTYSLGSFSGIVKYTSGYLQLSYDMAVCTTSSPGAGTSGSPVQDSTNKVLGIASSVITNSQTVSQTCGSGYSAVVVAYNGT